MAVLLNSCVAQTFEASTAASLLAATAFNQRCDCIEQLRFLIRLTQVVIDTELDRAGAMLLAHARRDHDYRHIFEARIVPYVSSDLVPIHARHFDVEQDDVGDVVLE